MNDFWGLTVLGWMIFGGLWLVHRGLLSVADQMYRQNQLREAELRFKGVNLDQLDAGETKA